MRNFLTLTIVFINFTLMAQNDSLQKKEYNLDEVTVTSVPKMKLKQKNGKYEVICAGTNFENNINVWEGLKQVPLLNIQNGAIPKVNGKTAIIEINGIQSQIAGSELENYLISLDPKSIKKIEIITNPNTSYGSDVSAVINIILLQNKEDYRLGFISNNSFKTRYTNSTGLNYSLNFKKTRLYTSYNFTYKPLKSTVNIEQQLTKGSKTEIEYEINDISRSHQAFINASFDINKIDVFDLTSILSLGDNITYGKSFSNDFDRYTYLLPEKNILQFAEVWKHNFNDSAAIKFGGYQVFGKFESQNSAISNTTSEIQSLKNNTPIYIGFIDYTNKNKYGHTSLGGKYNNIKVNNQNTQTINFSNFQFPFYYSEQIMALYADHIVTLSDTKSLNFGIRSETSFIDYKFDSSFTNESYSLKNNYTNYLYNINYSWFTKKEWFYNLAFRKQIERPNYNYLNPFTSITSGVTYFSGRSSISPAKTYSINYEIFKNPFFFHFNCGLIDDFMSTFVEEKNENIIETYRNFDKVHFIGGGFEYNKSFFKNKFTTKTDISITFFRVNDKDYNFIEKSTPILNFSTNNTINLGGNYSANVIYSLTPRYKDGLLKHYNIQGFDIVFTKKFSPNLSLLVYAYDIFKTKYTWEETTLQSYFYGSKTYSDSRTLGVSIQWNLKGKLYKHRDIEKPEDNSIDRYDKT